MGRDAAYSSAGPVRRVARQLVTLPPVAWASSRALPSLDRVAVRVSGGRMTVSGWVTGLPVVELVTTGRRSGEFRSHRVLAVPDEHGLLLVAANFGSTSHPAWFLNLRADPRVRVVTRRGATDYLARVLAGEERERGFDRALTLNPGWRRFQRSAGDRAIPVVELTPT